MSIKTTEESFPTTTLSKPSNFLEAWKWKTTENVEKNS